MPPASSWAVRQRLLARAIRVHPRRLLLLDFPLQMILQLFVELLLDDLARKKRSEPKTNYRNDAHTGSDRLKPRAPPARWPLKAVPTGRPHDQGPSPRPSSRNSTWRAGCYQSKLNWNNRSCGVIGAASFGFDTPDADGMFGFMPSTTVYRTGFGAGRALTVSGSHTAMSTGPRLVLV